MSAVSNRTGFRALTIAALAALSLSACGSQVSDERIVAAEGRVAATSQNITGPAAGPSAVVPGASGTVDAGAGPAAPAGTAAGTAAGVAGGSGATSTPAAGTKQPGGATSSGGSGVKQPAVAAASAPCTAPLAPVVIGQTMASSGLVGASLGNLRQGLQIWMQAVNARGGVQCHPVRVISMDDASDPARTQSNIEDLVKNKGAVAILGSGVPIPDSAMQSTVERLQIASVGGDLNSPVWTQSPYIFTTGGHAIATYAGALKQAAASKNAKKAGLLYCIEANICSLINKSFEQETRWAGVEQGPTKAISLTQTDFTAECQAFKAAGVDVVFFAGDGSAVQRYARGCASLNYFPPTAISALAMNNAVASDPLMQKFTVWLGGAVAPFQAKDSPGQIRFNQEAAMYAPGQPLDESTIYGWAAGEMLEAALGNVAAQARSGPITKDLVLAGLHQVKNETLDGVAPPVTFTAGKPSPQIPCYYTIAVLPGGFAAPKGGKVECFK